MIKLDKNKYITYAIVALIVLIIVLIVKKKFFTKTQNEKTIDNVQKDINQNDLSYNDSQYSIWADSLYSAMNNLGTDTKTVFLIFSKMQTMSDVLKVIEAFGERRGTFSWIAGKETLPEWIGADLSSNEINELNSIIYKTGFQF